LQSYRRLLANRNISCSRYLPLAGGIVLDLAASMLAIIQRCLQTGALCSRFLPVEFSKPVAGRRFCEPGFQNSFDKRRAAGLRR